jgi:hypothetical protein
VTEPNFEGERDDTLVGPRQDPDGKSQEPGHEPPLPGHGDFTEQAHRLRMGWVRWAVQELNRRADAAEAKHKEYHRVVLELAKTREEVRDLTARVKELGETCAAYEKVISSRKAYTVLEIGQEVYLPNAAGLAGDRPVRARVEAIRVTAGGVRYTVSRWVRGRFVLDEVPASEVMEELPLIAGQPLGSWRAELRVDKDATDRP